MTIKNEDRFCIDCKNFVNHESCEKVIGITKTPYCKEELYADCEKANKDNRCKYFEKEEEEKVTMEKEGEEESWLQKHDAILAKATAIIIIIIFFILIICGGK